ncbi:MAG TPA: DUF1501 domain-containing protein, partial [Candidatus Hydrogenedentes bacterium]|nr:DUF1501 domain-containing protein [Candidatus Hydrogenedentota bacterium]
MATTRREFLKRTGTGFGMLGLTGLLQSSVQAASPFTVRNAQFAPKAKSVIFLFMCGGVSAMDTFDPKDNKHAGRMLETKNSNDGKPQLRPVLHCPRVWTRYGKSATPVCEWFPHIGSVVDDIAIVRS